MILLINTMPPFAGTTVTHNSLSFNLHDEEGVETNPKLRKSGSTVPVGVLSIDKCNIDE